MHKLVFLPCLPLAILFAGCEPPPGDKPLQYSSIGPDSSVPRYRFAIHPGFNPQKLYEAYQPLVDYLNRQLPDARLELEASRDYPAFEQKFQDRGPAFLLPNPWQTLLAIKSGYHVIAMAGDAADFKGIFIVRKDGGIRTPADLKGKAVSYPSPSALAAAIMPQYFLHTQGIDIAHDIENVYVGSQESAIMSVYLGKSAAGVTWPAPWRAFQKDYPKETEALAVAWETPPLINNSVMVRDDVPASVRTRISSLLLKLGETPQGTKILADMETARFHAANDASYDVVAKYVERFEQQVRPVERR